MSSGKILLGILGGAAAGALLGVLFAPEKGSKTRKIIAKKSDAYADSLKEQFDEFIDSISGKYNELQDEVTEITEDVKSKVEDTKSKLEDAKSKIEDAAADKKTAKS